MSLFSTAIGIFVLFTGIWRGWRFYSSAEWQRTVGKIVATGSLRDHEYNLWPKIEYKYVADGKEYIGSTIYVSGRGSIYGHYRWIDELLAKYPEGSDTMVLYNPRNCKVSALERGRWTSILPIFAAGIFMIWVGSKGL